MDTSRLDKLIAAVEKQLENELENGLRISREIQEELERDPLDNISFLFFSLKLSVIYEVIVCSMVERT